EIKGVHSGLGPFRREISVEAHRKSDHSEGNFFGAQKEAVFPNSGHWSGASKPKDLGVFAKSQ
ncbi:hypothetical protein U1Q18_042027, partial [Sarracenia purpurea var. burkii]